MPEPARPRRFLLVRHVDSTGVSGTGVVAEGVLFSTGVVGLHWTSEFPTSVVFHHRGMESVDAVHGHSGATTVEWLDPETEVPLRDVVYEAVTRAIAEAAPPVKAETPPRATRTARKAPDTPDEAPTPQPAPAPVQMGGMVQSVKPHVATVEEPTPPESEEAPAPERQPLPPLPPGMPRYDVYECRECAETIALDQAVKTWSRFREFLCQDDFRTWNPGSGS